MLPCCGKVLGLSLYVIPMYCMPEFSPCTPTIQTHVGYVNWSLISFKLCIGYLCVCVCVVNPASRPVTADQWAPVALQGQAGRDNE